MNKKLIYSLIAGTLFTLTSCDDFLDVQLTQVFAPVVRLMNLSQQVWFL